MLPRINWAICLAAAIATLWMYWLVANYGGSPRWEGFLIIGGWNVGIYAANSLLAFVVRKLKSQSIVALISTIVVAGPSLLLMYERNKHWFSPPPPGTSLMMNCAGPIFELGLPIVQLTIFGLFAAICGLMALRSRRRSPYSA